MRDLTILTGLLQEQIHLHETLLGYVGDQRSQIARMQLADLEKTAKDEQRLASEIEELERLRAEEMGHWAERLGANVSDLTLRELVRHLGESGMDRAEVSELWALGEKLTAVIDEIRKGNAANRLMLKRGLRFMEDKFEEVTRSEEGEGYTLRGAKSGASRVPRVLNVRA